MDALLREALERARGDERLRVILALASESASQTSRETPIDPSQFASRADYRRALIEQRHGEIERSVGLVRQALAALSLRLLGGTISSTLVAEGTAQQVLAAIRLPGVRYATLDRQVQALRQPRGSAKLAGGGGG